MKLWRTCIFLIITMLVLGGCSEKKVQDKEGSASSENAGMTSEDVEQEELPLQISQENWVSMKQDVELQTGIIMKYVEMGQEDGDIIIFLHGMTDNSRSWSLIAPYFTDKYHIYMLDQRGHGDTDKPEIGMYPLSSYGDDCIAFMDEMGIEKAHIVGHSLGSMIAQGIAINYPERINKVVLESSMPAISSIIPGLYETIMEFGEEGPDQEFIEGWYWNPNPVNEDFIAMEKAESAALPAYAWKAITAGEESSDFSNFIKYIEAPTLILWGEIDSFFGEDFQNELRTMIPDSEFISYESTGHNIQWEIPERMAIDILAFLEK
ncbi:alpha/beta fold hydrolase [Dethiosulfatibacter aminovorans]|nr:alpha/beta hydrolase [Dethiosulfatibacter aminovorans]